LEDEALRPYMDTPSFASIPFFGGKVRLLTYFRPRVTASSDRCTAMMGYSRASLAVSCLIGSAQQTRSDRHWRTCLRPPASESNDQGQSDTQAPQRTMSGLRTPDDTLPVELPCRRRVSGSAPRRNCKGIPNEKALYAVAAAACGAGSGRADRAGRHGQGMTGAAALSSTRVSALSALW
jgi:hypothetical protein